MKPDFLLALLLLAAPLVAKNPPTKAPAAAPDSLPVYRMGEIVVIGERELPAKSTTLYEIRRKRIETLDVRNAQEALEFASGFYFSLSSKNEMTFRLRGFEQRQVSVYLDGVPISVPFDGVVDIAQLAGDNLESIRVTKGLSSVLYGANTLGGTVNIVTAQPDGSNRLDVRLEGSDQGRFYGRTLYQGTLRRIQYLFTLNVENAPDFRLSSSAPSLPHEDGGRRDNSAYRKAGGSAKLYVPLNAANRLGVQISVVNNELGVPPNALSVHPRYWKFPEWKKSVVSLTTEHDLGSRFFLKTVWFRDAYRNVLESYDDSTYTTQTRRYAFTSVYDDYSLGVLVYPQLHWFSLGSTNGILSVKRDVHRQKSAAETPFETYAQEIWTAGGEQELRFSSRWSALVGVDGNYLRPIEAEGLPLRDPIFLLNAQAALQYDFATSWWIHLSLGKKSRFPTLKELYSERLGRNLANPELKAEHSLGSEIALGKRTDSFAFQVTLFYNRLRDLIVNRQLGNNVQQLQNLGKAVIRGGELTLRTKRPRWNGEINYTYLEARNVSDHRDSDHLEYRPRHRLNALARYQATAKLQVGLEFSYTATQYYQNPNTGRWERLNDFALLNGKIGYRFYRFLEIYLRANNLTDRFYYSEFGVPMPGREILAGLKWGF